MICRTVREGEQHTERWGCVGSRELDLPPSAAASHFTGLPVQLGSSSKPCRNESTTSI